MATRENQTIQAALIVFVMITIALAVTTYIYYRKSEEKLREAAEAKEQLDTATKRANDAEFTAEYLKYMVGFSDKTEAELQAIRQSVNNEELNTIVTDFENDMKFFDPNWDKRRSYRELVTYLLSPIQVLNQQVAQGIESQRKADAERDAARTADEEKTQVALTAQMQHANDLQKRTAEFDAQMAKVDQEKQTLLQQITQKEAEAAAARKEADDRIANASTTITRLEALVEAFKRDRAEKDPESFDRADGRVRWVNQRSNLVWLDLGHADGLRRQMTFGVYDAGEIGIGKVEPKASIEVTQVLEDHLAVARINKDDLRNPILPNDQVFTAAWRPGRRLHFALTGTLDVTGDGKDDSLLVRNIIARNNAVVDAYVDENGDVQGSMSPETRYLVIGLPPGGGDNEKTFTAYNNMIGEARNIGVDEISLEKLLSYMGYTGEEKTVPLGRRGGDEFRSRQPPAAGNGGGAF